MVLKAFLDALPQAASSPLAVVCYLAAGLIWLTTTLINGRLKIIAGTLAQLPEADRAQALVNAGVSRPRDGMTALEYIKYRRAQFRFASAMATLFFAVVILAFAAYVATSRAGQKAVVDSLSHALDLARIGVSKARDNDPGAAVAYFESSIKEHPSFGGYMNLGFVYDDLSQFEKATEFYAKAAELDPQQPSPHINLGIVAISTGNLDAGMGELSKAEALASRWPKDVDAYNFLIQANKGVYLYERAEAAEDATEKMEFATRAFEQFKLAEGHLADARDDDLIARLFGNEAATLVILRRYEEADAVFIRAIAMKRKLAGGCSLAYTLTNAAESAVAQFRAAKDLALGARARARLAEAESLFADCGDQLGEGVVYILFGELSLAANDRPTASEKCSRASDLLNQAGESGAYSRRAAACLQESAMDASL